MSEAINPYASPESDITASPFADGGPLTTPGLKTTGIGLSLIYYGIIIILLAFISAFIGALLIGVAANRNPAGGPAGLNAILIWSIIVGIAVIVGGLLNFVGQIICLFVPSQSNARVYVIFALLLQILNAVFFIVFSLQRRTPGAEPAPIFSILTYLCGFLSSICFVLFMRKLSQFIGRRDFMDRARNIFVLVTVMIGIAAVMFVGMAVLKNEIFGLFGILLLILGLFAFVMYANLINALRKVLLGKSPRMQKSMLLGPGAGMHK